MISNKSMTARERKGTEVRYCETGETQAEWSRRWGEHVEGKTTREEFDAESRRLIGVYGWYGNKRESV